MLLVQQISLTWGKPERGGAAAGARSGFAQAYPFKLCPTAGQPAKSSAGGQPGALVQRLEFWQQGGRFLDAVQMARETLHRSLLRHGYTARQIEQETARRIPASPARWQTAAGPEKLDLVNIAFYPRAKGLAVRFYWDERRSGMPYRRGHNEDFGNAASRFCSRDCLNETAFLLMPGQYGRLVWNERRSDREGEWNYQLHLYNLYLAPDGTSPAEDVFTCREPDVVYRQMADLY